MKLNDEMIREAAVNAERMVMENLPPEKECEADFAEDFEERLYEKMEKYEVKRRRWYGKVVAASVICALLCGIGISPVSAALRERIIQFASVHFTNSDEETVSVLSPVSFGYLPEGMKMSEQSEPEESGCVSYFYDEEGHSLQLVQTVLDGEDYGMAIQYDGELERVEREDVEYVVYSDQESVSVIWETEGYVFHLSGNMDEEEMVKIAQNIFVGGNQKSEK